MKVRKEAATTEATEVTEAPKPRKTSRKRKIAYGVLGVVVLTNLMHGCGGDPEPTAPAPTPTQTATELETKAAERDAEWDAKMQEAKEQIEARKAEEEAKKSEEAAKEEAEPELTVVEPVPAEITDAMLAHQHNVFRTGGAAAVQDPETGVYVIAMEARADGELMTIVMGRESLEPGPARQWAVNENAEDALPRVPRAMDTREGRAIITSPAYEAAVEALHD